MSQFFAAGGQSFSISLSNEYAELVSFSIDWFDVLAVKGTLKSLLQHHNSKASNQSAMQETQVSSLGLEDRSLVKRMATHSNILAWKFPWTEVGYSPRSHRVRYD